MEIAQSLDAKPCFLLEFGEKFWRLNVRNQQIL